MEALKQSLERVEGGAPEAERKPAAQSRRSATRNAKKTSAAR
jgi:hypothetical protein